MSRPAQGKTAIYLVYLFIVSSFKNIFILCILTFPFALHGQIVKFERVYGGRSDDFGRSIQQTFDRGYIIAGATSSYGNGTSDVYLLKLDSNGIFKWHKALGDVNVDQGYCVRQTSDTGYVIAGYTNSVGFGGYDMYLIKTDKLGNVQWAKTYGGPDWDFAFSVRQTPDNGYIITGGTYSFGNGDEDVYIVRTNAVGDTLWTRTYGGVGEDVGNEVQNTSDGGFIISGSSKSYPFDTVTNVCIIKTDLNGDTSTGGWVKIYGGINEDYGTSVVEHNAGGFLIGGYTNSYGTPPGYNWYFIKTETTGDTLPTGYTQRDGNNLEQVLSCVRQTSNNGYIGFGTQNNGLSDDFRAILWNAGWVYITGQTYGGTFGDEEGLCIQQTADRGFIMVGNTTSYGNGLTDIYVIKTDSMLNSTGTIVIGLGDDITPGYCTSVSCYPNPVSSMLHFTLPSKEGEEVDIVVSDLLGNCIRHYGKNKMNVNANTATGSVDASGIPDGFYFISFIAPGRTFTSRVLVKH